jgi:hypothetical protein
VRRDENLESNLFRGFEDALHIFYVIVFREDFRGEAAILRPVSLDTSF